MLSKNLFRLWLFYDYNRRRYDDHDNDHNDYNNYNDYNHNICWSGYNDNDAFRSLFRYEVTVDTSHRFHNCAFSVIKR